MNTIVQMDKIEQFDHDIRSLQVRTNNYLLERALDTVPRSMSSLVQALQTFAATTFSGDDVAKLLEIIESGNAEIDQVDESVRQRIEDYREALRLLWEYAEIMEAPIIETEDGKKWINWTTLPERDRVTGRSGR